MKKILLLSTLLYTSFMALADVRAPAVVYVNMHINSRNAEELSDKIMVPMEKEIQQLAGVKKTVSTTSSSGDMTIIVEFDQTATLRELEMVKKAASGQAGKLALSFEKLDISLVPRPDF